jgi:hypothetical protein
MLLLAGISGVHMSYVKYSTMALMVLFISSCSSAEPPPPPKKTVFDPALEQLERAREVQKTVDEEAERKRQTLESQERGDNSK